MPNSPAQPMVDVGTVIDGTYIIEAIIGRGGMGAVFLAHHNRLAGKKVAIKMLHVDADGTDILQRFKTEAEIAAKLNHPNIVDVVDYKQLPDGTPYIVYEYLPGESLGQRLAEDGAMDLESVFSIMRQVGSALSAAHRAGVVHRDLKPANIFLVPTEADGHAVEVAKVLDFGISKIIDGSTQAVKTQEATLLGTPQYMSPEQAMGQHSLVDSRTDIFALGEILYEMVSGVPAFSGASIPEVVFKVVYEAPRPLAEVAPNVPDAVIAAIMKALEKKPEDRYQTVNDLVETLTGTPLSMIRKPRPSRAGIGDSPSQNSRNSSQDAFARTMGSGDHGTSPTAALAQTIAPLSASTVGSEPAMQVSEIANASTVLPVASAPAPAAAPPARGKRGALIGALALIAIGAAVLAFAMHGGHEPPPLAPTQPVAVITEAKPTTPPPTETPAIVPADAAVAVIEPSRPVATPVKPRPDTTSEPKGDFRVDPKSDTKGDDDAAKLLGEADAALASRDLETLERSANRVYGYSNTASPLQLAKAHMYSGIAQCSERHNDDEKARTHLRTLGGFPKLRAQLLKYCHDKNRLEVDH